MSAPVRIAVDELSVEIPVAIPAREVEAMLKEALELLAARLARAPLPAAATAPAERLARLEVGPLPPDWMRGPGGAARVADALYDRLARGG